MKQVIALLISFLIIQSASAADWELVSGSDDIKFYLDKSSIKKSNIRVVGNNGESYISAFVQPTYLKNHKLRQKTGAYYSKEQWIISCEDNSFFTNLSVDYNLKDKVIDSWHSRISILSKSDFNPAIPDTVGEGVVSAACNYYRTGDFFGVRPPLSRDWEEFKNSIENQ